MGTLGAFRGALEASRPYEDAQAPLGRLVGTIGLCTAGPKDHIDYGSYILVLRPKGQLGFQKLCRTLMVMWPFGPLHMPGTSRGSLSRDSGCDPQVGPKLEFGTPKRG